MLKHIYEHLKTRKKYNTLMLQYEGLKEELQNKTIELNTQKNINKIERNKFEEALDDYIQRLAKEKEKNKKKKTK